MEIFSLVFMYIAFFSLVYGMFALDSGISIIWNARIPAGFIGMCYFYILMQGKFLECSLLDLDHA
jgi:putative effector of murein hydrolase LrgA (UPF0299 family)